MEYVPTKKSLFASLILALSPVITAGVITYFMYESANWFLWAINVFAVLFSFALAIHTLYIHTLKLYLSDNQIWTSSLLCMIEINWSQVTNAVFRERVNAMSRTDHLLIIKAPGHILSFNTSILSPEDEASVLVKVKEKTNLVVIYDKPSI